MNDQFKWTPLKRKVALYKARGLTNKQIAKKANCSKSLVDRCTMNSEFMANVEKRTEALMERADKEYAMKMALEVTPMALKVVK